jgi:hypothetical protein
MAFGTHRIRNENTEDGVWVTDGKIALEIPEWRYISRGYTPPIDELPWDKPTEKSIDAQEAKLEIQE